VLSVAALFDVDEFVRWVSEDGNGATGILIRIDERRPIDPMAALPFDGKRGRAMPADLTRASLLLPPPRRPEPRHKPPRLPKHMPRPIGGHRGGAWEASHAVD
jgi:hypothetical protein